MADNYIHTAPSGVKGALLLLNDEYMDLVESGAKTQTIRKGLRSFYPGQTLTLGAEEREIETLVTYVTYKFVENLSAWDADKDGFGNVWELHRALAEIYPELEEEDFVTIIGFERKEA